MKVRLILGIDRIADSNTGNVVGKKPPFAHYFTVAQRVGSSV